eukprot:729744-Hanusia_phi.AAC.4
MNDERRASRAAQGNQPAFIVSGVEVAGQSEGDGIQVGGKKELLPESFRKTSSNLKDMQFLKKSDALYCRRIEISSFPCSFRAEKNAASKIMGTCRSVEIDALANGLGRKLNAKSFSQAAAPAKSKLEGLRETLQSDSRDVMDFVAGGSSETREDSAVEAGVPIKNREEEMHRSVLGQLKPDYVKVLPSPLRCLACSLTSCARLTARSNGCGPL